MEERLDTLGEDPRLVALASRLEKLEKALEKLAKRVGELQEKVQELEAKVNQVSSTERLQAFERFMRNYADGIIRTMEETRRRQEQLREWAERFRSIYEQEIRGKTPKDKFRRAV